MNYKKILIILLSMLFLGSFCSIEKYYTDENNDNYFSKEDKDVFGFGLSYPSYASKNLSKLMPGNEIYFKSLEGRYYIELSFSAKTLYDIKSFKITILNLKDQNVINEDGAIIYKDHRVIYNSFENIVFENPHPSDMLVHIIYDKEKFDYVNSLFIKCNLVLTDDEITKRYEFTKKVSSKYRIITPLDSFH